LKKRTKKLSAIRHGLAVPMDGSLFASFSSEKEDSSFELRRHPEWMP
jgi:hypothetical protein